MIIVTRINVNETRFAILGRGYWNLRARHSIGCIFDNVDNLLRSEMREHLWQGGKASKKGRNQVRTTRGTWQKRGLNNRGALNNSNPSPLIVLGNLLVHGQSEYY